MRKNAATKIIAIIMIKQINQQQQKRLVDVAPVTGLLVLLATTPTGVAIFCGAQATGGGGAIANGTSIGVATTAVGFIIILVNSSSSSRGQEEQHWLAHR
jgi:hypothetical protein